MKRIASFLLFAIFFSFLIPQVRANGIPVPPIRLDAKEEHQIVLIELQEQKIKTTLDLGIKNEPLGWFQLLEESVYINRDNPFWLKTFLLPSTLNPKELCIQAYVYSSGNEPIVKVIINGHEAYLYAKSASYYPNTYCSFISNQDLLAPQFVNVSQFFLPGRYNTLEIKLNKEYNSFTLYKVYLTSGEVRDRVRIIIPFKTMPTSVEIGGSGLDTWQLDSPFKKEPYWYGYYGGILISSAEAPALASRAMGIEETVKSEISQTNVAEDVSGSFQGKVADALSTTTLRGNEENYGASVKLAGELEKTYEVYLNYNAYVIELKIKPFELKRVVIKWEEDLNNPENFDYYYPLGTGKTWSKNISYTAIYVKLPSSYKINYASIEGMEKASDENYNFYRWKFIESNPEKDLYLNIGKISEIEKFFTKYSGILACIVFLVVVGIFIQYKNKIFKRGKR